MSKEDHKWCPLIKKDCIERKCAWYMHIRGMDPNTGKDIDHWGCAVSWMPTLLIENSQQQRSTSSAVESFRNEMVKANESNLNILEAAANMFYNSSEALEEVRIFEENQTMMLSSQDTSNQQSEGE
jgi:hypothetical protein